MADIESSPRVTAADIATSMITGITPAADIRAIPSNKNAVYEKDGSIFAQNYQSGRLFIKCIINNYCPTNLSGWYTDALVFNYETLKSLSADIFSRCDLVAGEDGLFLRSFRRSVHNSLLWPTIDGVGVFSGLNPPDNEDAQFFSWLVVPGPLDPPNVQIPFPDEYSLGRAGLQAKYDNLINPPDAVNKVTANVSSARWSVIGLNRHTKGMEESSTIDGRVGFVAQLASSFGSTQENDSFTENLRIPIHWKVKLTKDLFRGADFFIEFVKTTVSDDAIQSNYSPFGNLGPGGRYSTLDVNADNPITIGQPPKNQGVVDYQEKTDDNGNTQYTADEESKTKFDLTGQSYCVIEIGHGDKWHNYFIIITNSSHPTLVRVVKRPSNLPLGWRERENRVSYAGRPQYISYNLSTYEEFKGDYLFKRDSFTISVRNHLGKLVITFSGHEAKPWVISQMPIGDGDVNYMVVPAAPIAIWGGNKGFCFNFGLINYVADADIILPPTEKNFAPENRIASSQDRKTFEFPSSGLSGVLLLLSAADNGVSEFTGGNQYIGRTSSTENVTVNEYIAKRQPIFTCDAHDVVESAIMVDGSKKIITNLFAPYFMNTGNFLKDPAIQQDKATIANIEYIIRRTYNSLMRTKQHVEGLYALLARQSNPSVRADIKTLISLDENLIRALQGEITARSYKLRIHNLNYINRLKNNNEDYNAATRIQVWPEYRGNTNPQYDQPTILFNIRVSLRSAGHEITQIGRGGKEYTWVSPSCKTPILPLIMMIGIPSEDPAWEPQPLDASEYVSNFSDKWSSQDFHFMDHTGSITFLTTPGQLRGDLGPQIEALSERAFYLDVWAGYGNPDLSPSCNYSKMPGMVKLFTGVCYGGTIKIEAGKRMMDCKIYDYMKILQDQYFFNSPFFDGVSDLIAIHKICQLASLRDKNGYDPAYMVRKLAEQGSSSGIYGLDGRYIEASEYFLPASYERLKQPFFRFEDGQSFSQGARTITQRAGKVLYFDAYGMLHYHNLPVEYLIYGSGAEGAHAATRWYFTSAPDDFGQLIFNSAEVQISVEDVINTIHVITSSPERELFVADARNAASISDPSTPGFIGYPKVYFQQDGIFGNLKSTARLVNHYSKLFVPPVIVQFETYGQPLQCWDLAVIEGQEFVITNVSSELSPSENRWWQKVEAEWYSPPTFNPGGNRPVS